MATTFTSLRLRVARSTRRPILPKPACKEGILGLWHPTLCCSTTGTRQSKLVYQADSSIASALVSLEGSPRSSSRKCKVTLPAGYACAKARETRTIDADLDLVCCTHHDSSAPGRASSSKLCRGGKQGHGDRLDLIQEKIVEDKEGSRAHKTSAEHARGLFTVLRQLSYGVVSPNGVNSRQLTRP